MSPIARQLLESLLAHGGRGPDHPVFFVNELRRFPGDPAEVSLAWQELLDAHYVVPAIKFPEGMMVAGPGGQHFYATPAGIKWLVDGDPPARRSASATGSTKRFRVALSFAGEKRAFVREVAERLSEVFPAPEILYDKFHNEEFARARLGFTLPDLYKDSDLVAVFLCPDYGQKSWPGLEWRKIFEIIMDRRDEEVILFRWNHAVVEGLGPSDGFFDLDDSTPREAVAAILKRHARLLGKPADHHGALASTPSTPPPPKLAAPALAVLKQFVEHRNSSGYVFADHFQDKASLKLGKVEFQIGIERAIADRLLRRETAGRHSTIHLGDAGQVVINEHPDLLR